ncbi:FKBP-type peptidyl-prolyl cis-trans isomerase [Nitrosomonas halophila]|uniref:peptidylprolyl isomerase n=1 Tax=Nitrosomonas halophila TaxID=44576 RepID=A0A1H3FWL0_9PROT|nr:peptidylprolyl isomerase [Nitrosomonas halophila]SDX94554.1 FKBP-type peptidyl-prolyl cis-trans isomerase SlyD [Nitrosomonas halophila]
MRIEKNTVVSLHYKMIDPEGKILEETEIPISYLHGGFDGIFPTVEEALHEKEIGHTLSLLMEPEEAFGDYDTELMRVEPRSAFPEEVAIGMQFEGGEEGSDDFLIYTVTDVTDDIVVVDGNHPYAGMALRFECTVTAVRPATTEELAHGHVHGPQGHEH